MTITHKHIDGHHIGLGLLLLLFSLPFLGIIYYALQPGGEYFEHIRSTVLPRYITNTIQLIIGVCSLTLLMGVSTAWIISHYSFPGRRLFTWLLLAPLALPPYVMSIVYFGLFDYSGILQQWYRLWLKIDGGTYAFPTISNVYGASVVLSLSLFPYIFLLARIAFRTHYPHTLMARSFGRSSFYRFFTITLPMARPAIIGGLTLVIMETLSEFGAVQLLAVDTFTTGIYRGWYALNSPALAARLSLMLIFLIATIIIIERTSRGRAQYLNLPNAGNFRTLPILSGWRVVLVWCVCFTPVLFAFIIPVMHLLILASDVTTITFARIGHLIAQTMAVATVAAAIACCIALFQAYALRFHSSAAITVLVRTTSGGYVVPGAVLAVGVLAAFGWLDNRFDGWVREYLGISTGLLLSGTFFALIFAYIVRFMAVALNAVEAGLSGVRIELDWLAQLCGYNTFERIKRIHLPLIRPSVITAFLLVTIECVKELPATLIIRPFNFETLATATYVLASDERIAESSIPALILIALATPFIFMVNRHILPRE